MLPMTRDQLWLMKDNSFCTYNCLDYFDLFFFPAKTFFSQDNDTLTALLDAGIGVCLVPRVDNMGRGDARLKECFAKVRVRL